VEERLARAFCENPEPFHIFSSSDGLAARVKANRRGLVAVFLGCDRWSLEGKTYRFLAIPSGLAERMACGAPFILEKADPQTRKVLLIMRKRMVEKRGEAGTELRLADGETIRDIERQLREVSEGTP